MDSNVPAKVFILATDIFLHRRFNLFLALDLSTACGFLCRNQFSFHVLRLYGVPITTGHVDKLASVVFAECLLIFWIGRQYYWRVIKAACGFGSNNAHAARQHPTCGCSSWVATMVVFLYGSGEALDFRCSSSLYCLVFLSSGTDRSGIWRTLHRDTIRRWHKYRIFLSGGLFHPHGFSHAAYRCWHDSAGRR